MSQILQIPPLRELKKPGFDEWINGITGYKPNNWQKIVSQEDTRFKVISAGRRSGKSFYVAYDNNDGIVTDFIIPEQKVWVVAPNYDLTQRIWNEVYNLAISKFKTLIQRIRNTKGDFRIETKFGTVIEAKSAEEPEKLVGAGLTKIIMDEAGLVKEKTWKQSLRPTLLDHKGRAIFISTPKGKNWFWSLWQKGQTKEDVEWKSWRFTSFENEYLDREELGKIVKDMPEYEYRQEILAEFEETAEQIFRKYKERAVGEFKEPQKGHRYQIGIDLGRKTSYSVISVIDEMEYPYPLVYHDRFRTVDWNLQKQRYKQVWDKYSCLKARIDATATGGDIMVEDLEQMGMRIEPFIFKETSKRQVIDKLAVFIQDGRIIYPKIPELLNELETYGREISEITGRIKYKPLGKFKDDCVDSLALACWGLPQKPRQIKKEEEEKPKFKPISDITGY